MSTLRILAQASVLVLAAAACGLPAGGSASSPPPLFAPAVDRLTEQFGCDEFVVARDAEKTVVVAVEIPGILARSRGAMLPYREELEIGGDGVVVRMERGADLDHWCTDVMDRPPRIDAAWVGVTGRAEVELVERRERTSSGAGGSRFAPTVARVHLKQAVLAREDDRDERLTLPALEITATLGVPAGG